MLALAGVHSRGPQPTVSCTCGVVEPVYGLSHRLERHVGASSVLASVAQDGREAVSEKLDPLDLLLLVDDELDEIPESEVESEPVASLCVHTPSARYVFVPGT